MVIVVAALWLFSTVFQSAVRAVILCKGLSSENFATVALIPKNLDNASCCPLDIAQIGFTLKGNQRICDLLAGITVLIHIERQLNRGSFLRVND